MKPKSKYEADLHCHTTASDGLLSPRDVMKIAAEKGLKAIAITDHDTIKGWHEAEEAAKEYGLFLLKGIEINTEWAGKEIHILGYGLNVEAKTLTKQLADIQQKRVRRIEEIIRRLNQLGNDISLDEVLCLAKGESVGRPHIAQVMIKHGLVNTIKQAFDQYLKKGAKAYVPRYKLTPQQAIGIICDAEGIAVIAHPGVQKVSDTEIIKWCEAGLEGIEVYHPDHSSQDNSYYEEIAIRLGLLITGGSDFHGLEIKPNIEIGSQGVSWEKVEKIRKRLTSKEEE